MFTGAMTALITPFRGGHLDEEAFQQLVAWQIDAGIDAIVVSGTTGEAATLSPKERLRLIELAKEVSNQRAPVIAGTGSNNTVQAITLAQQAKAAGADAHLSVTPYYNKPMPEGLFQHFTAIANAVELPMILYNVPGRTAVNMLPETVAKLAAHRNIVGLKEAAPDIQQIRDVIEKTPDDFCVLSGEDAVNVEIYQAGGKGCISVTANVVPDRVSRAWDLFNQGKENEAAAEQEKLMPLNRAFFMETNPIPVKTALALMGSCQEEFRLPLTTITAANRKKLEEIVASL